MAPPLSKQQEEYLYDLYYNKHFLFGRDRIFHKAKQDEQTISERQIMAWLKDQHIWQLYKPTQKSKDIRNTVLKEPNQQIGCDLIDMTKYEYKGFNYIFTCVDLFSKKTYAYPLKQKSDAFDGLEQLLRDVNDRIASIRSDNGTEFLGKFTDVLNDNGIKQVFSLPHKPQSNGNIERFNGILKRMIKMALKMNNSYDWVKILPTLIENYNSSLNYTTKKIPNEISR